MTRDDTAIVLLTGLLAGYLLAGHVSGWLLVLERYLTLIRS